MLTYSFENIGNTCLYEHLYNCIKADIINKKLPADYKLPSKRAFAKNLDISTITVENAYGQLMAEGFIYSVPKSGFYVSDIADGAYPTGLFEKNCCDISAAQDNTDSSLCEPYSNLISNKINASLFPFYTWYKTIRSTYNDFKDDLLKPSPAAGIYELRNAISRHLKAFRNMDISPEQIIIGAGTEYLYSLLIQFFGYDKIFAIEDPGYSKISMIYKSNNVNCLHIPLDKYGCDIEVLKISDADILHISPTHHYPTGIVTSIRRRNELLKWAAQIPGRYIIEDDYDSEFRLTGKPIPSLMSIDKSDRVIYMNTFTKTLTSTIRISYMVLPKEIVSDFNKKLGFYSCTVSNFEQFTLAEFINKGYFEKHINRMRNFYKKQRNQFIHAIEETGLSAHCSILEENAGLHFLLKVSTPYSDELLINRCREQGIIVSCLSEYYYDKKNMPKDTTHRHTLVINYSSVEPEKITETFKRILEAIT